MTITSIEEIFEHELADIYFAEEELFGTLEHLEDQVENQALKEAISSHRGTTEQHLDRVEQVFEMMGEPPEEETCEGMDGLLEEQREFMAMDPDQAAADLFTLVAIQKTEHYEIAAYGNLALLAHRLDMDDAAQLLHDNLEEEQHFLEDLKRIADEYDFTAIPARPSEGGESTSEADELVVPTGDEEGKTVVDTTGAEIGMVTDVEGDTMYVDPHPSTTETIAATLDWDLQAPDDLPVSSEFVERIDDDVVLDVERDDDFQERQE